MIKEFEYNSRLRNIFLFVGNLLKHGLDKDNIFKMTSKFSEGLEDILDNPKYLTRKTTKEEKDKIIISIFKRNFQQVSNYRIWVLNYGWLMICSVFEEFLADAIKEVLVKNPELCSWDSKEEIVIQFKSKKIKPRIKYFMEKLNLSESEFLNFHIFEEDVQKEYHKLKISDIIEIFDKRHEIAHTDGLVIKSVKEFERAKDIFDKLILNISFQLTEKWSVETEVINFYKK